ncbi:hypothetical protein J6590_035150 [Homalodisca vitripennis]|nr:hypothetical protein J6590_035150 [Homalodisca vitripennis]
MASVCTWFYNTPLGTARQSLIVCVSSVSRQVTEFCQIGTMDSDIVIDVIDLLETQVMEVYPVIQHSMVAKVQKHIKEKNQEPMKHSRSTAGSV